MGTNNLIFLENIEWFDESGKELVHRIPETGSGEIKWGAQLTVRESQVAVFFYKGKAVEAFGPGRHTLQTGNIPILTKIASLPWGMTSPLRAEVYFYTAADHLDNLCQPILILWNVVSLVECQVLLRQPLRDVHGVCYLGCAKPFACEHHHSSERLNVALDGVGGVASTAHDLGVGIALEMQLHNEHFVGLSAPYSFDLATSSHAVACCFQRRYVRANGARCHAQGLTQVLLCWLSALVQGLVDQAQNAHPTQGDGPLHLQHFQISSPASIVQTTSIISVSRRGRPRGAAAAAMI